jgi:tRNA threonylcarbamoyladenosine biosynthesis protein TsaB
LLLAIDTSAGTSAAVISDRVLAEAYFSDPFGHAENIGTAIEQALREANVTAKEITAVAIGRGPAPYTGLRVGMAAGLSFATALGIPSYGVMVFDAVAHSLNIERLLLISDAKRRELFVAAYENGVRTFGPEVMEPSDLARFEGFHEHYATCSAGLIGQYALWAIEQGLDLSDVTAIYLRSPDVSPSSGKRVTG